MRFTAVSYTHLDVYKRQDVNVAEQPATVALSHPEASTSGAFLIYKKTPALITEQADVYKRQGVYTSNWKLTFRWVLY